ncbi:MAG TPA: Cys-tRNA(Pro) deacylase [Terriglobales bacterium]|nr:Cys-tRNA(Pro) deacylase [Terriglobales bacterium]
MAKKTPKTNAARQLDNLGIQYELREYEVDPDHLEAELVADKIGMPYEKVFKTLLVRGDVSGLCMAVIAANAEVDFKALADATGDRKIHMVPLKEVQPLTGYIRGGVTALACKKPYPVYIDSSAEQQDVISVSAGVRGMQILLKPADYVRAVSAKYAPISSR